MTPGTLQPLSPTPHLARPESQPEAANKLRAPLPSQALLQGQKSVTIDHQGEIYRLQTTRQGKLILTK